MEAFSHRRIVEISHIVPQGMSSTKFIYLDLRNFRLMVVGLVFFILFCQSLIFFCENEVKYWAYFTPHLSILEFVYWLILLNDSESKIFSIRWADSKIYFNHPTFKRETFDLNGFVMKVPNSLFHKILIIL